MVALSTYFASTVQGLESVLAAELAAPRVGAVNVEEGRLGVHFMGGPEVGTPGYAPSSPVNVDNSCWLP